MVFCASHARLAPPPLAITANHDASLRLLTVTLSHPILICASFTSILAQERSTSGVLVPSLL
jgi:hypothetical protein